MIEPLLKCFDRHFQLWNRYRKELSASRQPQRADFEVFKLHEDPACAERARERAPVLYFDFIGRPNEQYVLLAIDVTTIRFSEYKGGGFAKEEAWYDIVLRHEKGTKRYEVDRKLVFSGTGRCKLTFWSDNFYPGQGWIAPMGEYMIDIAFTFTTGEREVKVSTGPFKIDV